MRMHRFGRCGAPRTPKSQLIVTLRYRACRAASEFAVAVVREMLPELSSSLFSGWCQIFLMEDKKKPIIQPHSIRKDPLCPGVE